LQLLNPGGKFFGLRIILIRLPGANFVAFLHAGLSCERGFLLPEYFIIIDFPLPHRLKEKRLSKP
jgi:hypothetical protein